MDKCVLMTTWLNFKTVILAGFLAGANMRRLLPQPHPTRGSGSPKKWQPVTPAMAAGLTDHVWTMEELLSYRVPPDFRDRLDQQTANVTS
jgi:hypothetical protein